MYLLKILLFIKCLSTPKEQTAQPTNHVQSVVLGLTKRMMFFRRNTCQFGTYLTNIHHPGFVKFRLFC